MDTLLTQRRSRVSEINEVLAMCECAPPTMRITYAELRAGNVPRALTPTDVAYLTSKGFGGELTPSRKRPEGKVSGMAKAELIVQWLDYLRWLSEHATDPVCRHEAGERAQRLEEQLGPNFLNGTSEQRRKKVLQWEERRTKARLEH